MDVPKTGIYSVNGEGKTLASMAAKIPIGTFVFMVTQIPAEVEMPAWCADLVPAGQVPEGHQKEGHPHWVLQGHPKNSRLILDGDCLLECDEALNRRRMWSLHDNMQGSFYREQIGAPTKVFPSENFKEAVLSVNPLNNEPYSPSTQVIVEACTKDLSELPDDPKERQIQLIKAYTLESPLYHEMNTALREDNLDKLRYFGSYIKELRDVFKTDHEDQIITPFEGKIWRGIHLPDVEKALIDYTVGTEFVWPAFTSMSTNRQVACNFGNVAFEINCDPPEGTYEDDKPEYAPAAISQFSDFPSEDEVLFPPNISFRVLRIDHPNDDNNLNLPLVVCKVVGFDTDTGVERIDKQDEPQRSVPPRDVDQHDSFPGERSKPKESDEKYLRKFEQLRLRLEEEISRFEMTSKGLDERLRTLETSSKERQQKDNISEKRLEVRFAEQLATRVTSLERVQNGAAQRCTDIFGGSSLPVLDSKVATIEKAVRSVQELARHLEEAIDRRGLDLKRLTKDTDDKFLRLDRCTREAAQHMATVDRSLRACSEKQVALEHRQLSSEQGIQQSLQSQGENLRRLTDTWQQMPTMFEERVTQSRAVFQRDVQETVRTAMEHLSNQMFQKEPLPPGCMPGVHTAMYNAIG